MLNLFKSKNDKSVENINTLVDGIHEIRDNYTTMLHILEESQATLNDYLTKLNEKEDNGTLNFMYESHKRQYKNELETFNYLYGGGEQ